MWQRQHDVDDFARMERMCRDMAVDSTFPLERAGLLEMAENYRAAGEQARWETGPTAGPKGEASRH
ncbi:hypothetical protein [Bradyrhizobium sp. Gha]|uniref:hypothetical protein n=1 Tax=Bradyrhizobium sp. Gha TaxID=1855318 RepID=UPI0008E075A1|nr:hypothetical protein [Bradyrhizobium sp. Gha]SFI48921.1 hypothetical protein SAMN05216525_109141 [Bradyrhizobium sp. Gha]